MSNYFDQSPRTGKPVLLVFTTMLMGLILVTGYRVLRSTSTDVIPPMKYSAPQTISATGVDRDEAMDKALKEVERLASQFVPPEGYVVRETFRKIRWDEDTCKVTFTILSQSEDLVAADEVVVPTLPEELRD